MKLKNVARFLMEFILTISLTSFLLVYIFSKTLLSEAYVLHVLNKTDYYDKVYELVESNFKNYIQQSGLDEKILEDVITKEQVSEDTKSIVSNIYDGFNSEISTEPIRSKLTENIDKEVNIKSLDKKQQEAINSFIDKICDEYIATISNTEYESGINNMYNKIMRSVKLFYKIDLVLAGLAVIIIVLLNMKRNYKIFTNWGIGLLATGSILTIINVYINLKIKVQYLTVLNEPVSNVLRTLSADILSRMLRYGLICMITGALLIIISNTVHNIIKYRE